MEIRPVRDDDRAFVKERTSRAFGSEIVVSRGDVHRPHELAGFLAIEDDERRGVAMYRIDGDEAELVTLEALVKREGVGTVLLQAVEAAARAAGCRRLWLITGNDNLEALRFYQRRGYRIVAVHPGALDRSRELKPTIPKRGLHGIPLHDELELARPL